MSSTRIACAALGAALLASPAIADLNDVRFEPVLGGPAGTITCRVVANFSDGDDRLAAVWGSVENPLIWSTLAVSGIINDNPATLGTPWADQPHGANGPYDTWFTIEGLGGIGPWANFSPMQPGCSPGFGGQYLTDGCTDFMNENNAYFAPVDPIPLSQLDPGGTAADGWDAVIAQFTVSDDGWANPMHYEGMLSYVAADGPMTHTPFFTRPCEDPCPPDINGDSKVDVADMLLLLGNFGCVVPPGPCPGDINDDGIVDVGDLLLLIGAWGECSP